MSSCIELVHVKFDLLVVCIFMIITRCLSTKYSLLLFWYYFFPVFPAPCYSRPVHPCDCLEFTNPPQQVCPDVIARCVDPTLSLAVPICSYVVAPSVLSHLRVVARWTASAVLAKALILAFGILSRRDMPKIFRSIFLWQTWIIFFWLSVSFQVWLP